MTIHQMSLSDTPFTSIKAGGKTLEIRLYDEKRKKIDVGDQIIFSNNNQTVAVKVIGLSRFASFYDLFTMLGGITAGWKDEDMLDSMTRDMRMYYSEAEERKYGVLGIHLQLV